MGERASYEFLSRDDIDDIARCAAFGAYIPHPRHAFGFSFTAVVPGITILVCAMAFRLARRRLLRRLQRSYGGAPFSWQDLLAEVRRRDRNATFRT
ncbi:MULTISPECIES: hypothetical protein [Streptomyces]|uniref:Uncharacterized protein n=1 Tax=Streptomyces achromogenes TaxID=67255 RepID=A0ABU0QAM0_STRAH|nr:MULTISPECIES: hypothetical protein [Streptomyces]MDQ0687714.1 hypothetical protein [Streptomyces achromogenes]MDQ0834916.1 hypothetical protein [Streptomyces achromogenes]MDQ0957487.1 hypothetical protein [Streptomyces sp. B4I13]